MPVLLSSILDQKHPLLCGADAESYSDLHIVPSGYRLTGKGGSGHMAHRNLIFSVWVRLVSLERLPTLESRNTIINPWVGWAHQPWLAS